MEDLKITQRRCKRCGTITSYSKHDIKTGDFPDDDLCAKCRRGEKSVGAMKPDSTFSPVQEILEQPEIKEEAAVDTEKAEIEEEDDPDTGAVPESEVPENPRRDRKRKRYN